MRFLKNKDEEKINSVTHSFGAGFLFCGFIFLDGLESSLYCLGMMVTMALSTLYHGTEELETKSYFRVLDMLSIHLMIAISACAYMLPYKAYYGCVFVSTIAICGMYYTIKKYGSESFEVRNVQVYLATGFLSSGCTLYVLLSSSNLAVEYFLYGLLLYMAGLIFYIRDGIKWFHTIWHVFVMVAAYLHLEGIRIIVKTI